MSAEIVYDFEWDAAKALSKAFQAMDKAAKTHVLHKNTVSRLKSRLAKAIAKIK